MTPQWKQLSRFLSLRGKTTKDSFWIGLAKIAFFPHRIFTIKTSIGHYLLRDSIAKTSYGFFFCKGGDVDLGFISESFESNIVDVFKGVSGVVVDCGAHIGKYTILASKFAEKVIAIEPEPENYKSLTKNIKLNNCKNVIALNCAVCNKNKKLKLYIKEKSSLHFTSTPLKMKRPYKTLVEVDGIKIDDLFNDLNIDRIDWLKLDIEGAEIEALLGAKKALKAGKILNIIIELHLNFIGKKNAEKLLSYLKKNKYLITRIFGNYYLASLKKGVNYHHPKKEVSFRCKR